MGRPTEGPTTHAAEASAGGAVPVSPVPADYRATYVRVGPDSFVSWGHAGGRYAATVFVNADARGQMPGDTRAMPAGAVVVMADIDRATRAPGPTYSMVKGASGAWTFGVMESPQAKPEELLLCVRCHREAPHDGLFALPE